VRVCITPISEDYRQKDACGTAVAPSNRPPFRRRRQRKPFSFACPVNAPPPPLFVSFASLDALVEALPDITREECEEEIRRLAGMHLPAAASTLTVSTLFGVSAEFIGAMTRKPQRYYRSFIIRKGKKNRTIDAPKVALKIIQKWIGFHMAQATIFPNCVYGFVPGKNGVIDAAKIHCEARWVYSLDLRDFFPSISRNRVVAALMIRGYSERSANLISRLCTLNERLPQGSPASPVLSNLVFQKTDSALMNLSFVNGVRYSRYADDLVFSGAGEFPVSLADDVKRILIENQWEIAPEKEFTAKLPERLKVHGLLVHGAKPRLTKGYRNKIRAYKHLLSLDKVLPDDVQRIKGHLSYAKQVDGSS